MAPMKAMKAMKAKTTPAAQAKPTPEETAAAKAAKEAEAEEKKKRKAADQEERAAKKKQKVEEQARRKRQREEEEAEQAEGEQAQGEDQQGEGRPEGVPRAPASWATAAVAVKTEPPAKKMKVEVAAIDFSSTQKERKCSVCPKLFVAKPGASRCDLCNSASMRVSRLVGAQSDNDELAVDWELMGENEKKELIVRAHQVFGADLKKLITESIEESWTRTSTTTFAGNGKYLDLTDLRDKYKEKPERLANIEANTQRLTE